MNYGNNVDRGPTENVKVRREVETSLESNDLPSFKQKNSDTSKENVEEEKPRSEQSDDDLW